MKLPNFPADKAIDFRFAEEGDIGAIVDLLFDDALGARREHKSAQNLSRYVKALHDMKSQGDNEYLLAVNKDQHIVGCVQITLIAGLSRGGMKRAQLEGVRVAKTARGHQIGTKLIKAAIQIARAADCGLVQLTTDKQRDEAARFYQSLGFESTHEGMKLAL